MLVTEASLDSINEPGMLSCIFKKGGKKEGKKKVFLTTIYFTAQMFLGIFRLVRHLTSNEFQRGVLFYSSLNEPTDLLCSSLKQKLH